MPVKTLARLNEARCSTSARVWASAQTGPQMIPSPGRMMPLRSTMSQMLALRSV